MVEESALALVKDVKGPCGIMTSAPAMAEALIVRLQTHAGLTFAVEAG